MGNFEDLYKKQKLYLIERMLTEMPQYKEGNWDKGVASLGSRSDINIDNEWQVIKVFKIAGEEYEFRKFRLDYECILGYWDIDEDYIKNSKNPELERKRFIIIARIFLTRQDEIADTFNIKDLYQVREIAVLEKFQKGEIAQILYKFFVNELNFCLISDANQYFGARKLWSKFTKVLDLTVDVVNLETKQVLEKNVKINHGQQDKEYDKDYWSEDESKKNIRFVLKSIK